jgi:tol-pal system protein YbgF
MRGLLCIGLLAFAGQSFAGLFDDDEARRAILDLRQKLETNRTEAEQKLAEEAKRSSEEAAQLRRALVDLQNQLEVLRAELAKLRGQDEQIVRDVAELQRRQRDSLQTFDERLRKFEPATVSIDGREILAEAAEKRGYETSLAIFRKGEFAAAQGMFVDFLTRYPQSGYRPSALFWLGNAQYATKDYKDAITNFRSLVAGAPDHMRAPEAVLAIANCQLELKDAKSARKTLEEVLASYPTSEAAGAARERLARIK